MARESGETLRRKVAGLMAGQGRVAERFQAEITFAEGLAKLHPDKATRWSKLIDQAYRMVAAVADANKVGRLEAAVAEAERILAPIGKTAKGYTIHCVGHAHIDMNWLWSWPETVAITNDTFTTVLKLMDEFPDFCFTQSQASVYAIVRDYNPALLEGIRRRVAEGRWEVAAVQWVEGDKNIASGESLARHLLYTRRFMKELFDLEPEDVAIDWEPDTFGHAWTIPTIDSRAAVKRYYMCRGGAFAKPPVYWWQGPDGSRLLVYLDSTWYGNQIGPHNAMQMLAFCEKTGLQDSLCVFGVGDHGGGPTRRDLVRAGDMDTWPIFPHFRFSTTRDFYSVLEANGDRWSVLERELNFEFTGCYTSQAAIKHANRFGENYCVEAEALAAIGRRAAGCEYPSDKIRQAWVDTIFGHFHDILPGSGVAATRYYHVGQFQKTAAATGMIKTLALRALAAAVDTSAGVGGHEPGPCDPESIALGAGAGIGAMLSGVSRAAHVAGWPRAFLVANPTAWARQEIVTAPVWDVEPPPPGSPPKTFVVRDPKGRAIPTQQVTVGDFAGHRYIDLAFPASVGALGYAAYVAEEGTAPPVEGGVKCSAWFRSGERIPEGEFVLESECLSVLFDKVSGGIIRLVDKTTGCDLATPADPLGILEYVVERPRGMSAWIISDTKSRTFPLELESFGPELTGPYVATMVAKLKIHDSAITLTYMLRAGQPWLEISVQVRWLERGGHEVGTPSLKMRFPLALAGAKGRYETPFGSIERDLNEGQEVPALRWADVTGKAAGRQGVAGCALLNDSKYGHALAGSTLTLTLLRSSYDPDPLPEIGDHTIRMAVAPHGKALEVGDLVRMGAAFNHSLIAVPTDVHKGRLPAAAAAVADELAPNVILSSLKKAEDDESLIFHLFETAGKKTVAKVALGAAILGTATEAVEVDLLERPVADSSARLIKNGFSVTVPAHGIAAVKVSFAG